MKKGGLNKTIRSLGTLIGAFLLASVVIGLSPQSAQAVAWLPTAAIVEAVQELKETHGELHPLDYVYYPRYVLNADNFVLHLDDFDDIDDADIIELSNALLSIEGDSSLDTTPTAPIIVVKENALYPAVGMYEVVLGLEEGLEKDIEATNEYLDLEVDYLTDYPYAERNYLDEGLDVATDANLDYLNYMSIDVEGYFSLETTVFPTAQIYVFIVDDNTTVEEGVVFYASNFRKNFTERASLDALAVKERAQARAYKVMTGLCISGNIFLDEEKLTEFAQSELLEPQDFTLSVPATSTPMSAEAAEVAEIPLVSTSITIRTRDDRPPIEYIPTPPPRPPGNDGGGNDNANDTGNDSGGGGGNNGSDGGSSSGGGGNNNAGGSGSEASSSGTAGTSSISGGDSGNERRPAWTSSVARSPVQVSPSTPSEAEADSDEDANDEIQLTDGAATTSSETSPTPTPTPIQAAPTAEASEGLNPLIRNALIAVGLTALVAGVIALYLYLQKKNLERKKPPVLQKS